MADLAAEGPHVTHLGELRPLKVLMTIEHCRSVHLAAPVGETERG